jgi:hypothetical protein
MRRGRPREPAAPSALDERLSLASLRSSPWVAKRIKELGLQGKLVKGWTPPYVKLLDFHLQHVSE